MTRNYFKPEVRVINAQTQGILIGDSQVGKSSNKPGDTPGGAAKEYFDTNDDDVIEK